MGLGLPPELEAALKDHGAAWERFRGLPPSHQREYVRWINEAKGAETRQRRVRRTVSMVMKDGP